MLNPSRGRDNLDDNETGYGNIKKEKHTCSAHSSKSFDCSKTVSFLNPEVGR